VSYVNNVLGVKSNKWIVYDPAVLDAVTNAQSTNTQLACIVAYGQTALANVPLLIHAMSTSEASTAVQTREDAIVHSYKTSSPYFIIPGYGPEAPRWTEIRP
jgi:hypothetical protein